ncbi:hypothetical protein CDV31_016122 [Fusarium ambrosium]|uniref:Protein kinase domain-containing protein n=1 Tax=Fusarium ambrosium TaxID=131363 RepID=A0A428SEA8_9HYPO|nr:hypothetical protein CDV31_016122 [Fusarium ambrosium]
MNKECLSDVPSELDAALEWKFAISEQEAPERDPVLKNLRIGYEQSQSASMPREQRKRVRLLDHIHHTLAFSVFDQKPRRFCPNGSIDTLITEKSVTSLAEFISVSAKKLFAILVLNGSHGQLLKRRMEFFREKDITDLSLPLHESWWDDNYWHGASRDRSRSIDESNYDSGGSCENEELWPLSRVERFCHAQRWFLVPIFSDTGLSYDFEADTILPFTEREHNVNHGGFERITRYRIHERHIDQQTTDDGRPYYVAVQEAYENILEKDPAWESQIQMLSRMNSLDHEHIVRFLAAFRRVKAAFRQMVGLTSAIHRAHYPPQSRPSRHGHLKPEKIFWFNDDNDTKIGTLKISGWEFGEGARRTIGLWVDEFERKHGTHGARRYEAPELATDIGPLQSQSCLCDIWSMGCIMLEFLIWLMYGVDGLNRFSQARQSSLFSQEVFFYQVKREGQDSTPVVTVDSVVLKWMDHMAADPACNVGSTALGNLLELIRTRLLVVKLPQEPEPVMSTTSLQVSVGSDSSVAGQSCQGWERCKSSELEERMREIWDENETEKYWLAGDPKSPPVTKDRDLD